CCDELARALDRPGAQLVAEAASARPDASRPGGRGVDHRSLRRAAAGVFPDVLAGEILREKTAEVLLRPLRRVRIVFERHAHDALTAVENGVVEAVAGARVDDEFYVARLVPRQKLAVGRRRHAVGGAHENEGRDFEPLAL